MSNAEFWLRLASVIVPSIVVVVFALLNRKAIRDASAAAEKRDAGLDRKVDGIEARVGHRMDRLEDRIDNLRGDVMAVVWAAANAAGIRDGRRRVEEKEPARNADQETDRPMH